MLHDQSLQKRYDLRWRFDFAGRPSKFGKWSSPGQTKEVQAWCNNREGLSRAAIEGKDVETGVVKVFAECDGWNYVNFQWMVVAMTPAGFNGAVSPVHALVGLKILTREFELSVLADGSAFQHARSEAEKTINFATFGR